MRFFHPSRRGVAAALALLAAAGIAGAAAGVAAASSAGNDATASAALDASQSAAGHTHTGSRAVRAGLVRLLIRATVKQTGLSRATVLQDLRAGQTLNQVAGAKAGTVAGDVLALVKSRLDRAVTAHRMTAAQEQTRLAAAQTAINDLMSANLAAHLPERAHRG